MRTHSRPLVGVVADTTVQGLHRVHQAGEKYITSVVEAAGAIPVLIPSLPTPRTVGSCFHSWMGCW